MNFDIDVKFNKQLLPILFVVNIGVASGARADSTCLVNASVTATVINSDQGTSCSIYAADSGLLDFDGNKVFSLANGSSNASLAAGEIKLVAITSVGFYKNGNFTHLGSTASGASISDTIRIKSNAIGEAFISLHAEGTVGLTGSLGYDFQVYGGNVISHSSLIANDPNTYGYPFIHSTLGQGAIVGFNGFTIPLPLEVGFNNYFFQLSATVANNGLFGNTIGIDLTLPDGTSFTSGSGLLLTTPHAPILGTIKSVSAVPEPASWSLMLIGFGAVGWGVRRNHEANPA
jgi:hypothetical protein